MAEPEVATKAPESDATAASTVAGDTPVQTGAGLGVRRRPLTGCLALLTSSRSIV